MAALGMPRETPNRQTWAVVQRNDEHAVVAVVFHDGEYHFEEVFVGDLPNAVMHGVARSRGGS